MSNDYNRWLICHSLDEGKTGKADNWKSVLQAKTASKGRDDKFTTGKEDFFRAKKMLGNKVWKEWPKTRATERVHGADRFTRALVPIGHRRQPIGRGTHDILVKFFEVGKPVYAWDYRQDTFIEVTGVEINDDPPEERAEQFRQFCFLTYAKENDND